MQRSPERVKRLMRACARNQGAQAANITRKADILANDTETLD